ncbi:MAG: hypothetical protein MJE12_23550 [Alphaproteobacteria bacterium]|nr:hypothetical protein [Alphaproteobacteria bacterium]
MDLPEYKEFLIDAVTKAAEETSDESARGAYQALVGRLREMDPNDQYLQDALNGHGNLPDESQRNEALRTALSEFHAYDAAEQLATVFLVDLKKAGSGTSEML